MYPSTQSSFRVYTHNILARRARWETRRPLLQTGIKTLQPDIALFQEEVLTPNYDQTQDLLGPAYKVIHTKSRSADEKSGISIASHWPMRLLNEIDLTNGNRDIDEFIWAALIVEIELLPPIGSVIVVNYFPEAAPGWERDREKQAVVVARAIEHLMKIQERPVILAGDMDAEPDSAGLRFLAGKQSLDDMSVCYRNAWAALHPEERGWTLDPGNELVSSAMPGWPFRQIDHIFIRCGSDGLPCLDIRACELVFNQPVDGIWASDHFGLIADLGTALKGP